MTENKISNRTNSPVEFKDARPKTANVPSTKKTNSKPSVNLKYDRDKDRELVKGRFRNLEIAGGTISFPFRSHKGDPIQTWNFTDGEVYRIPLGVAKHLNNNCWVPSHEYREDETGKMIQMETRKVHRFSFTSMEFTDIPDLNNSDIIEVQTGLGNLTPVI